MVRGLKWTSQRPSSPLAIASGDVYAKRPMPGTCHATRSRPLARPSLTTSVPGVAVTRAPSSPSRLAFSASVAAPAASVSPPARASSPRLQAAAKAEAAARAFAAPSSGRCRSTNATIAMSGRTSAMTAATRWAVDGGRRPRRSRARRGAGRGDWPGHACVRRSRGP
jgi:hypothetical protein